MTAAAALPIQVTAPHPHQLDAVRRIVPRGQGAIFADMGTGKGLIALLCASEWGTGPTLVLCPKSVLCVWETEPDKHFPGRWLVCVPRGAVAHRVTRILAARRAAEAQGRPLLVAVNYEAAISPEMFSLLKLQIRWQTLVLDESHRIKSAAGRISRAVSQIADRCDHRLLLTGTPMPHSPMDLYAQFRAMRKGVLPPSATTFRARYAVMGGFGGKEIVEWRNLVDLAERIDPWTVRVTKAEVLGHLPPWQDTSILVALPPKARRAYDEVLHELQAEVAGGRITAANAAVRCIRLQQITNGVVATDSGEPLTLHTEKQAALEDLLTDLPATEPVVVFGSFHSDLDAIRAAAHRLGRGCLELSGRVRRAHENLRAWQAGQAPVLAVQFQSGGVGIDLSRAAYCVFYSRTWSLGDYEQARARVHRPGQERPVSYYHLIAEHSMDQTVQRALDRKEAVVDSVIAALGRPRPERSRP